MHILVYGSGIQRNGPQIVMARERNAAHLVSYSSLRSVV